eukprot:scaffold14339_cov107-Isochrysis_galbana.AAC.3
MDRRRRRLRVSSTATGPTGGLYRSTASRGCRDGVSTCARYHREADRITPAYWLVRDGAAGTGVSSGSAASLLGDIWLTARASGDAAIQSSSTRANQRERPPGCRWVLSDVPVGEIPLILLNVIKAFKRAVVAPVHRHLRDAPPWAPAEGRGPQRSSARLCGRDQEQSRSHTRHRTSAAVCRNYLRTSIWGPSLATHATTTMRRRRVSTPTSGTRRSRGCRRLRRGYLRSAGVLPRQLRGCSTTH